MFRCPVSSPRGALHPIKGCASHVRENRVCLRGFGEARRYRTIMGSSAVSLSSSMGFAGGSR